MKDYNIIFSLSIFLCGLYSCNTHNKILPDSETYGRVNKLFKQQLPNFDSKKDSIIFVETKNELQFALKAHSPKIILLDGDYDIGYTKIDYPVEIRASNLWKSVIKGSSFITINSNKVIIEGIKFEDGASPSGGQGNNERYGSLRVLGNEVKILNNFFKNIGIGSTISDKTGITIDIYKSNDVTIANNVFMNSHSIAIKTDDFSNRLLVEFNDFNDSINFGGAGEVLHLGNANSISQGIPSQNDDTYSIFRNNKIINWSLELELISIKSSMNIIEKNFLKNCENSAIVIRMGNKNIIRNNIISGNKDYPIRISGEENSINNNTFCGEGSMVSLHSERVYIEKRPNLYNSYWAANNNIIESNIYYGYSSIVHYNKDGYSGDPDVFSSDPKGNVFKNNHIFYKSKVNEIEFVGLKMLNNNIKITNKTCERN